MWEALMFYFLAALAVGFSIMVVITRIPVHSALSLGGVLISIAAIFITLEAEFLSAVQILVYVGGIMVLFLFVLMLFSIEKWGGAALHTRTWKTAVALGVVLAGELLFFVWKGITPSLPQIATPAGLGGNIEAMGWALYQRYLLPFEVASVLLLVAIIGAVLFTRKQIPKDNG